MFVKFSVPARVASVPVVGNVTFVVPVEVNVIALAPDVARVDPLAIVRVPVEDVIVKPLIDVADAAPNVGVVNDGELAKTSAPDPVSSLITPASSEDVVAEKNDSLLAERATVPVKSGKVYVLAADRSAFVNVPVNDEAPADVIDIASLSSVPVAESTVSPRIVAPPVNDEAVDVVAPRPVTEASVSDSAVRNVPDDTFSITPVDVFLVRISYPPAEAVGDVVNVSDVANVGAVSKTTRPDPVSLDRDVASCDDVIEPDFVP